MIDSRAKLEAWLKGRPAEYAQVIAARVALRVLPYAFDERIKDNQITRLSFVLFRANFISWAACNFPVRYMAFAAARAAAAARAVTDTIEYAAAPHATVNAAADAANAALDAHAARYAVTAAANAERAAANASYRLRSGGLPFHLTPFHLRSSVRIITQLAVWASVSTDCNWLDGSTDPAAAARRLTREPLWPRSAPQGWNQAWKEGKARLLDIDPSYDVWTGWYDRRIIGNRAAFDIPGDSDRTQDKAILARLADATNEDWWDKGATHVNTELQGWIDEAYSLPQKTNAMANYAIKKSSSIDVFFATCRETDVDGTEYFTHRRAGECTYGIANVHIPIERSFGSLRRPHKLSIFSVTLFEMPENARTHFIVNEVKITPIEAWRKQIDNFNSDEALIFVHGFNMNFRDGLYRAAQIFHDLQYGGIPILFSWASGGRKADYLYDKDSANVGEKYLIELLAEVASTGIKKVHILAHSMGNALVIAALEKHNHKDNPLGIVELMMAAPDVDCDVYGQKMPALCKAIPGLTLYASATDNALALSKTLARNKMRAGDISNGQPVLIEGVDAIDITEIGSEIFGLGHGAYASTPSILNDIGQLVNHRQRPPSKRLSQIRGMPEGATMPKWWKFVG